jgi:hypothetical protein
MIIHQAPTQIGATSRSVAKLRPMTFNIRSLLRRNNSCCRLRACVLILSPIAANVSPTSITERRSELGASQRDSYTKCCLECPCPRWASAPSLSVFCQLTAETRYRVAPGIRVMRHAYGKLKGHLTPSQNKVCLAQSRIEKACSV